ncbi:hypothetical protein B2G71_02200 [Novosphingobium sp. PC22D]|uniref:sterol desaturase family protein n=1 Tax=Novosphingobium sp. PC22D TaxID=1962403 RepID=UPI000BEF67DC|nr:sterol desaturase family protein [Novosphingobium sp. PC22D]PEQ14426.1 hypothetical protein B2G71_02200 [Novosphingobium sp. PC22D]
MEQAAAADTGAQALTVVADTLLSLFNDSGSRIGFPVLLTGWLIAMAAWLVVRRRERSLDDGTARTVSDLRAFLRHAFPASAYWSRSAAVDGQLALFNKLLLPARWLVFGITSSFAATQLARALVATFDRRPELLEGTWGTVMLGGLLLLAFDFSTYVTHRLSHEMPALWAFHRVHHSAEALNPLTLLRKHPVYDALSVAIDCAIVAPIQALIIWQFGAQVSMHALGVAATGFAMFAYAASSLRHTHLWLSFGPLAESVLVSPALHQIHHSRAERHHDRNYGEVFSIWDLAFGTLYRPQGREDLEFGLTHEAEQPHRSLVSALLEPFGYAARHLTGRKPVRAPEPEPGPMPAEGLAP